MDCLDLTLCVFVFKRQARGNTLRILSMNHMKLSDKDGAGICAAVENNGALKSLDMSNNDLGEKSCIALNNALMVSLPHTHTPPQ